jgi:killing trait domain-containing protein
MTKSAQDFARELTTIVDASAHALTTLNRVLEQQQQSILALASEGSVPVPITAGTPGAPRPATAQAMAPATATVPAAATSPESASPAALSPEALLAQAGKTAQALLELSPELALAHVFQASAHAVSLALMNTATAQQQLTIVAQAVLTRGAANQLASSRLPAPPLTEKTAGEATPGPRHT